MALSLETTIRRGHQEIVGQVEADRNRLTVREMNFARLIAEENYTQSEAYKEAFQPSEDAKPESIQQLGCRYANKPRVAAEIERIRIQLQDTERSKDERLGAALDGAASRQLIALELFAFVMSPSTPKNAVWLKALELLGKQKQKRLRGRDHEGTCLCVSNDLSHFSHRYATIAVSAENQPERRLATW